jgi:amino acid transporter
MTTEELESAREGTQHLRGHMGVVEVALSVLAFSSPLTTAWGYLPFVIFFAGIGAPVAFLVAMVLLLVFSVGYVTMSKGIPNPGAFYSFVAHGLNKSLGLGSAFLASVGYFLLISGVSCFFGIASSGLIADFGGPTIEWYWLTALLLLVVGAFGYVGIEFSAKTLTFLMMIEILIVVIFNIAVLGDGGPEGRSSEPFTLDGFTSGDIGLGVMYAIVMFIGFEGTAIFREEARDPDRTIPRATYISVAFIGLFYALTVWSLIVAFGPSNAVGAATNDPAGMFPGAFADLVGSTMQDIASVFVLTAVFASTLACHNIFSRYMFSLGVDGALPANLGRVHPKQGSPYVASITASVMCVVALVVVVAANLDPGLYYGRVAGVASLCIIILMLITSIAVLIHFGQTRGQHGSTVWHTRVAPALATLGLGAIVFLALKNANAFMASTTALSITFITGIVALFLAGVGLALYLKARRPEVYARIGRQSVTG